MGISNQYGVIQGDEKDGCYPVSIENQNEKELTTVAYFPANVIHHANHVRFITVSVSCRVPDTTGCVHEMRTLIGKFEPTTKMDTILDIVGKILQRKLSCDFDVNSFELALNTKPISKALTLERIILPHQSTVEFTLLKLKQENIEQEEREKSNSMAPLSGIMYDEACDISQMKVEFVPDKERPQCVDCGISFTVLIRRHHCRVCGEVFCKNCSRVYKNESSVRTCSKCRIESRNASRATSFSYN